MIGSEFGWIFVLMLGFAGAFFGTTAGGSGLLIIPGLIALGYSSKTAIVTLEVGALGMMISGAIQFYRNDLVDYKLALPVTVVSLVGAFTGSLLLVETPAGMTDHLLGAALLLIVLHVLLMPRLGVATGEKGSLARCWGGYSLIFINGIWSGFFSAGSHIFGNYILLSAFQRTFLQAASILKIEGLGAGLASSLVFFWYDMIDWVAAIELFIGMTAGAWIGTQYGVKKGNLWVKILFLAVVSVSSLRLLIGP